MAIEDELGSTLAMDLVRVLKMLQALRATAPRFHDAVEQSAYPVLMALRDEPARITALAERIHTDASVVSRQISHLEQLGLVDKSPAPDDRRASVAALTSEGADLVDSILAGRGQWFARMLSDWTPDQARDLDEGLRRLADSLQTELRARGASDPATPIPSQENA